MKVLIFAKQSTFKNIGGPQGYLYNINEYLKKFPSNEISFLKEESFSKSYLDILLRAPFSLLLRITNRLCPNSTFRFFLYMFYSFCIKHIYTKEELNYFNQFDYIHIHDTRLVLTNFYPQSGITAKIILTSHCPEPLVNELINSNCPNFFVRHPKLYKFFLRLEAKAYDYCDKIMFPVMEAREPYENADSLFKSIFTKNEDKFFYVPTALDNVEFDTTNNHVLDSFHLGNESLKICYIGRHNSVKGYDFLKESAKRVWEKFPSTHFIIGGKQDPLKGLDDFRWHEMGWVHTPSLLNEVDVFILPNRQTYFDLILLEVLRQGTPVILSRTGGNKWFEKNKKTDGIFFYDENNIEQLIDQIKSIYNLKSKSLLDELRENNRNYFKQEFSMSLYIKRYLNILNSFLS